MDMRKPVGLKKRSSGILLHPTSLPSEFGIGDFGPDAFTFIDFLHDSGQTLWQILPLGPTGYGNSPYQSFSAFAGNPLLISPEKLIDQGLLSNQEAKKPKIKQKHRVDYGSIIPYKQKLLEQTFHNYSKSGEGYFENKISKFYKTHESWLDEYALFMSLKEAHNLKPWQRWKDVYKFRNQLELEIWKKKKKKQIDYFKFTQFLFFLQWEKLKDYANSNNVRIIGDIPIFVAYDSVDVWLNRDLFFLNPDGELLYVAGVPPDYFSSTGQRWGNPLYRWNLMKENGFRWWVNRIKHNLEQVDLIRIDHFRGFESYWQIPAEESTAVKGEWIIGPGITLFHKLEEELGVLPIIAEDLGVITPEVEDLLLQTGFPGMRVLQFAFDEDEELIENNYLPENFTPNTLVYTGTHDNQTTKSWYNDQPKRVQQQVLDYTKSNGKDIVKDIIRLAWSSVANIAIIPLQDLLRLDDHARMNTPGTTRNNWEWRFSWDQDLITKTQELLELNELYNR